MNKPDRVKVILNYQTKALRAVLEGEDPILVVQDFLIESGIYSEFLATRNLSREQFLSPAE
jgi:hypothetical protein